MRKSALCSDLQSNSFVDGLARLSDRHLSERHVFVYGTLRKALRHKMAGVLAREAHFVGEASVPGMLFDLGTYPGLVVNAQATGLVQGEIYALRAPGADGTLAALDEYEGCAPTDVEPHEYRRILVQATLADGPMLSAWAYVLNRPLAGLTPIPTGDYVAWRRRSTNGDDV
jgi:gamma-glutamylcyclotransferase (GGCT)/AIG2-like uncharacterized protein YtfP